MIEVPLKSGLMKRVAVFHPANGDDCIDVHDIYFQCQRELLRDLEEEIARITEGGKNHHDYISKSYSYHIFTINGDKIAIKFYDNDTVVFASHFFKERM